MKNETNTATLKVLVRADEFLTKERWVQRSMYSSHGGMEIFSSVAQAVNITNLGEAPCMCMVGAIRLSDNLLEKENGAQFGVNALNKVNEVVRNFYGINRGTDIISFNDSNQTKFEDVKFVLSETIKGLQDEST